MKIKPHKWVAPLLYRSALPLMVTTVLLGPDVAAAQFAKVVGTVSKPRGGAAVDATINRMSQSAISTAYPPVSVQPNGEYTIEPLRPGKYDLFACGFPYWPDQENGVGIKLKDGDTKTIRFVLEDPPEHPTTINVPFKHDKEPENDDYVYLKDTRTGCVLDQQPWKSKGLYKFIRVERPFTVCARKRQRQEEYKCYEPQR